MDQYDSGLAALKNEPDAAWRSDKLVELSRPMVAPAGAPYGKSIGSLSDQSNFYGKRLEFDATFNGANAPRTGSQAP